MKQLVSEQFVHTFRNTQTEQSCAQLCDKKRLEAFEIINCIQLVTDVDDW